MASDIVRYRSTRARQDRFFEWSDHTPSGQGKHCGVRIYRENYRTRTISRTLYSTPSGRVRPALLVRLISMIR